MNGIKFGQQRENISRLLKDWQAHVDAEDVDGNLKDRLHAAASSVCDVLETDAKYRVSLLGEFSAGKSSLIMALTGAEVATGAGVTTTEVKPFKWKGVTLVDTPGVQAEKSETDQDEIARNSTLDADLILFVMTNEFFNQRLTDYFHFVAGPDGLNLADKILVIVNKMDRESNEDETIISEVENAISPLLVRVHLAAVGYYLKSQKFQGDRRERFVQRSRMGELIAAINEFIEERGEMGRLTRPLQLFEDALEEQRGGLLGDNESAQQKLELNRRQKRTVHDADRELTTLEMQWTTELRSIVMSRTTQTLDEVSNAKTREELEELFQSAVQAIEPEIDTHFVNITNGLQDWVRDFQEKIEELDISELGKKIRNLKAPTGSSSEFDDPLTRGFDFVAAGRTILGQGVAPLLEKASKDPKNIKKVVEVCKKMFDIKFKPYGKIKLANKLAKGARAGNKALGPIMAAMDFYLEYRNEQARDAQERHLAKTRLSMQRQFLNMAEAYVKALRNHLSEIRMRTTDKMLNQLDEQAAAIITTGAKEKNIADLASEFILRSRSLRNEISTLED